MTLYLRGREIDLNSMFLLTIAGTRSASNYGIALAEGLQRRRLKRNGLGFGAHKGIDERSAEPASAMEAAVSGFWERS